MFKGQFAVSSKVWRRWLSGSPTQSLIFKIEGPAGLFASAQLTAGGSGGLVGA